MTDPAIIASLVNALLATGTLAAACAALSVFVVARRWAFIGEGISHSGFGGAGTAWLLALAFPALDVPWFPYAAVVVFCLGTAVGIGVLTRGERVSSDVAIGIFLVASLAWGFLARDVYYARRRVVPLGFDTLLFGQYHAIDPQFALAAVCVSVAVLAVLAVLGKEILYYCLDPVTAQASGVRVGFIHYLLMLLLAATIVLGSRVVGSVLVTALLVLPGATAMLVSRRLSRVVATSLAVGLVGAAAGLAIRSRWPFLPFGPAIVLSLFAQFLFAYAVTRLRRRAPAA
jgi:ABC-type Mn2+/Zn2+ transport system permease subunit